MGTWRSTLKSGFLGDEESIARLQRSDLLSLEQKFEELKRAVTLNGNIDHEQHARMWEAIDRLEQHTNTSKNIEPTTNLVTELQLSRSEISDLREWMPDLKHKHRENLDNARTTDE